MLMEPVGENNVRDSRTHPQGCPGLAQIPVRHRRAGCSLIPMLQSLSCAPRHCSPFIVRCRVHLQLPRGFLPGLVTLLDLSSQKVVFGGASFNARQY